MRHLQAKALGVFLGYAAVAPPASASPQLQAAAICGGIQAHVAEIAANKDGTVSFDAGQFKVVAAKGNVEVFDQDQKLLFALKDATYDKYEHCLEMALSKIK